mgnify:CR=1 FL=1
MVYKYDRMNGISNFFLYGKGVFTTIAIYGGKPMLWEKHVARLPRDMQAIGLDPADVSENELREKLAHELERGGIVDGRARITISDETPSPIWQGESAPRRSVQVLAAGSREVPDDLHVTISRYPINSYSPLAGVKSCNYLENLIAIEEAKRLGFYEAIRLNERQEVTSTCMANVFWLKEGELFTPSLQTGCLPGTTREYVLENVACKEVEAGIEELRAADSIFLTSAGLGIVEVDEFDGKKLSRSDHPIMGLWPPS